MLFRSTAIGALLSAAIAIGVPRVVVQTIDGTPVDALAAPAGVKAMVFVFTSTDCPISNRYAPELQRIAATFASKGVAFRFVYPNPVDTASGIREHLTAYALGAPSQVLRDPTQALVKFAHATVTPEAAVVVGGRVVYLGRIDDRYVELGVERSAPTRRDLAEALSAVLEGRKVAQPATQAVGCFIADFAR